MRSFRSTSGKHLTKPAPNRRVLSKGITAGIECSFWLAFLAIGSMLGILGAPIPVLSVITLCILAGLILSTIKNFDGGRHPCFLFLSMLFIFQAGRLLGSITGYPEYPLEIVVQTTVPFFVSVATEKLTLLAISLSAICIYIPCRLRYKYVIYEQGKEAKWIPTLYFLILIFIPFTVYKNYRYLSYIRSHGGYIAVYTQSAQILQTAGSLVRILSLIGSTVLLLLFLYERRPKRILFILVLFFSISTMELLIGFRGKFFVEILVLWYIYNLKTGKQFKILRVLMLALLLSLIGVLIAGFREEKSLEIISPTGFIATQGVSINVTEAAIEYRNLFKPRVGSYIIGGLEQGLKPNKNDFSYDISNFLNADAVREGYSTGSSYLAEAYLLGGISGIIFISFLIGSVMTALHNNSGSWRGATVLLATLTSLIYLPRSEILSPLDDSMKTLFVILLVFILLIPLSRIRRQLVTGRSV